jgi:S-adenosylmethionine:tRNA ribosyltransferase-isomerase
VPTVPTRVTDYNFDLPEELIAQSPPADRAGARMLTVDRATGARADRSFRDLPDLLRAGDLLVLNDTRVLPARLYATRATTPQSGQAPGRVEVLLTEQLSAWEWKALVRPGRKVQLGQQLLFSQPGADDADLRAKVIAHGEYGERTLRFTPVADFFATLDRLGHMPLPPYIARADEDADKSRYQTVFARERGSVAAPTAGLHFTDEVLAAIRARGVEIAHVTLHVGLGTFQPVRVDNVADIKLHSERYTLPAATAEALARARAEGRRIVAAGTTTVRTLEHCAANLTPHSGETSIFLSPGHRFQLVDALLTNFHLPQSTLLMLVCAFAGYEPVLAAYRHAVEQRYRFFSYGDCMFLS